MRFLCALILAAGIGLSLGWAPLAGRSVDANAGVETSIDQPSTKIVLRPSDSVSTPGSIVTVDVAVQNVSDLAAFDFALQFNNQVLEYMGVSRGTFLTSTGRHAVCAVPHGFASLSTAENVNNNAAFDVHCNTVGIVDAGTGTAGPSGDGTLATITFRAVAQGEGSLAFRGFNGEGPYFIRQPDPLAGDAGEIGFTALAKVERCSPACDDGIDIPFDAVDGIVVVAPPATETPTATRTSTATATASPTPTPVPTLTSTATPAATHNVIEVLRRIRDRLCARSNGRSAACRVLSQLLLRFEQRSR